MDYRVNAAFPVQAVHIFIMIHPMDGKPVPPRLEFRDFTFTYPGRPAPSLRGVSFPLSPGEMAVVSGRNGAGKSTLALAANGTIPHLLHGAASGGVFVDGEPAGTPRELASRVGVVFQDFEAHLVSSSVTLEAAFPLENAGWEQPRQVRRVAELLELVGLSGFGDRVPSELSGGEKQRLAIAAAMAPEPALLVLDEPLTDLDPLGKLQVLETVGRLRGRGVTILMVEHDPQALLAADTLLVLDAGKLAWKGKPAGMLARPEECRALGLPVWAPAEVARAAGLPEGMVTVEEVADGLRGRAHHESAAAPVRMAEAGSGGFMVSATGLSSGYSGGPEVLHGIDLTIRAGECVALLGQNGSGKTTLAKHFTGLLKPRRGELLVRGKQVRGYAQAELSRLVGYVFQNPDHQIFSATVIEEVSFGLHNLGLAEDEIAARASEALRATGLAGHEGEDPFALTRGERQRLAVASLLAYRPEMIIFDEPTTALDAAEAEGMVKFIAGLNAAGTTVLFITHAMWVAAEYAKRAVVMSAGKIVMDGPVGEVFAREAELAKLSLAPPPAAALANRLGLRAVSTSGLMAGLGLVK